MFVIAVLESPMKMVFTYNNEIALVLILSKTISIFFCV